jgi:hypothetical protein
MLLFIPRWVCALKRVASKAEPMSVSSAPDAMKFAGQTTSKKRAT